MTQNQHQAVLNDLVDFSTEQLMNLNPKIESQKYENIFRLCTQVSLRFFYYSI